MTKTGITLWLAGMMPFLACFSDQKGIAPDIILIMSDDMGYSDIGCYGGEIETPNLDRLAENGLRFRQFYNNAGCCPIPPACW